MGFLNVVDLSLQLRNEHQRVEVEEDNQWTDDA